MEAQNNAMIQHNVAQADWARNFAQQSLNAQLQMAQLQAQLQLRLALLR
jgi:fructosamine-3-kinase